MLTDRRGASETIGFVLVFSLIVLTVGVVLTVGYSGLQDARDAERVNNAERAFDVFGDNIEDITRRGAPSRGTEIRLSEATIKSGSSTYINVSGEDAGGSLLFTSGNYSIDTVVYRADDTRVRYGGGAVTRVQSEGSLMVRNPNFVVDDAQAIIPIVQLSVEDTTISGSKTVLIRSERRLRRTVVDNTTGTDTLRVNVSTPAPDAWERYLEDQGMDCSRTSVTDDRAKLVCTMDDVDRVRVVWYEVKVTFE